MIDKHTVLTESSEEATAPALGLERAMVWHRLHNRLVRGSVGAELWSASVKVIWSTLVLIVSGNTGIARAQDTDWTIFLYWSYPWSTIFVLAVGIWHLWLLLRPMPVSYRSIVARKVLAVFAFSFWVQVTIASFQIRGIALSALALVVMTVLLFYSILRREY